MRIVAPSANATVDLPVTLRWTSQYPSGTQFAVFLDRAPVPPGRTLKALAENDPVCRPNPNCPDELWLTQHYVHVTADTALPLGPVPFLGKSDRWNVHTATIVVLGRDGRRRGEAAYAVSFRSPGSESGSRS